MKAFILPSKVLCLKEFQGSLFVGESSFTTRELDLKGNLIKVFKGHQGPVSSITIAQFNVPFLVTGSWDKNILVFDLKSGKILKTLKGHSDFVKCLASNSDILVSVSSDKTIRIWNKEFNCVSTCKHHSGAIQDLVITGEFIFACSSDCSISKWDFNGILISSFSAAHKTSILCLTVFDRFIVSGSADNNLIFWDLETENQDQIIEFTCWVKCLAVTDSKKINLLVGLENGRVLEFEKDKVTQKWDLHFDQVSGIVCVDGKIFSGSLDGTIRHYSDSVQMTSEEEAELADLLK